MKQIQISMCYRAEVSGFVSSCSDADLVLKRLDVSARIYHF